MSSYAIHFAELIVAAAAVASFAAAWAWRWRSQVGERGGRG